MMMADFDMIGIGLSLFVAELTGVYFTGGSLNPARSFGPAVVNMDFVSYHWIYWVGPVLGSIVAAGFYKFIKILEYENANPNQDASKVQQQRKSLLMAAGINEAEAEKVANRLSQVQARDYGDVSGSGSSEKTIDIDIEAPKTPVKGLGLGTFDVRHREVMYGTVFGSGSTGSSGDSRTIVEESPCGKGLGDGYNYRV
jgi:aquaporin related protein